MGEEAVIQELLWQIIPGPAEHSGTFFIFFPLETIWKGKLDLNKPRMEDFVPEGQIEQNYEGATPQVHFSQWTHKPAAGLRLSGQPQCLTEVMTVI